MSSEIIMTVSDVADFLRVDEAVILRELESGRLRGRRIGDEWRTTQSNVLKFLNGTSGGSSDPGPEPPPMPVPRNPGGPRNGPRGTAIEFEWSPAPPFAYRWPSSVGAPESVENYADAYMGLLKKNGRVHESKHVLIGFTERPAAGMDHRKRATVFLVNSGRPGREPQLYPMVEFAGANDFETSRRMASVIKLDDRRQLKMGDPLPPGYERSEVVPYSEVVTGPYAANGLAVVVQADDLDAMAHHALMRRRQGPRRDGWLDH
jgi:hypothetical protein